MNDIPFITSFQLKFAPVNPAPPVMRTFLFLDDFIIKYIIAGGAG